MAISLISTAVADPMRQCDVPVFGYVLLKLASRCNLACDYCYWFRDHTVYAKPALLVTAAEDAFCQKLAAHIDRHSLDRFQVLFHGGEPLLFPKTRFVTFLDTLALVARRRRVSLDLILTTNGVRLDPEWITIFKRYGVGVSLSIDGPPEYHNAHRLDHRGRGTYANVVRGLRLLQDADLRPGVIAVCNPQSDPCALADHLVYILDVKDFDVLPPDLTHDDVVPSIASYYITLFHHWYEELQHKGVTIRMLDALVKLILGHEPTTDSVGYAPVHTVTMLTDGALEPLDVLRIAGDGSTASTLNIFNNTFQDVAEDPVWMRAYNASLNLPLVCRRCEYVDVCGGGHLAHRWSGKRAFDNASIYCADWKVIIGHIAKAIADDIRVRSDETSVSLGAVPAPVMERVIEEAPWIRWLGNYIVKQRGMRSQ